MIEGGSGFETSLPASLIPRPYFLSRSHGEMWWLLVAWKQDCYTVVFYRLVNHLLQELVLYLRNLSKMLLYCTFPYQFSNYGKLLRDKTFTNWRKYDFHGEKVCELFSFATPKEPRPQILRKKLLWIATKPWNSWKFSPLKVLNGNCNIGSLTGEKPDTDHPHIVLYLFVASYRHFTREARLVWVELWRTWASPSLVDNTQVRIWAVVECGIHVAWCFDMYTYVVHTICSTGIDDARNTAKLCHRMVRDGCRLNITKCIHSKVHTYRLEL